MLGLFTNSINATIIRPTCCSGCGTAVSEIRISCEDTLNFIRPRNVIEFEGLAASNPELKLKIDNLDEFVEWIEETGARDLHRLEGDLTGWLWTGLIERISLDQRSWG